MKISEAKIRESFRCRELREELPLYVTDVTDSTMQDAKKQKDTHTRAVFIADFQTAGRGRLGRKFISEEGVGLYMTLMLTPSGDVSDTVGITAYTAVVTRRAIEELTGIDAEIKWVNDIVKDGKKLSGILTEGIFAPGGTSPERVIVGIGINVHGIITNDEIKDIATTIESLGGRVTREELAARIIELFYSELYTLDTHSYTDEYRSHSSVVGKRVTVIKPSSTYPATVTRINDKCELILSLDNGDEEILMTGEVSIKI